MNDVAREIPTGFYSDQIFLQVGTVQDAMHVILTPEDDITTEERWVAETPHLCDLILRNIDLNRNSVVLDFGCGIGRVAKELIKRTNCFVVGCDFSYRMRALGAEYVQHPNFISCAPEALHRMPWNFDAVLAIWVLQHIHPWGQMERFPAAFTPGTPFFVVNSLSRCLPLVGGKWGNDGLDVRAELAEHWDMVKEGKLNPDLVKPYTSERTYWATYRRK